MFLVPKWYTTREEKSPENNNYTVDSNCVCFIPITEPFGEQTQCRPVWEVNWLCKSEPRELDFHWLIWNNGLKWVQDWAEIVLWEGGSSQNCTYMASQEAKSWLCRDETDFLPCSYLCSGKTVQFPARSIYRILRRDNPNLKFQTFLFVDPDTLWPIFGEPLRIF